MIHPEIKELIEGPIAQASDLKTAIIAIEKVKVDAAHRLGLKNKSLIIQDSTYELYQDDDYKLHREASYIQECLQNGGWHGHLNYADYAAIQDAVKLVKKFTL